MTRPRSTIAQLMACVLYAAFGFAALRNADDLWADATYTIAIISLAAALLGAIVRGGRARVSWIGYAVFGWTYLLLDLLPAWTVSIFGFQQIARPHLLIGRATAQVQPYISKSQILLPYDQVSHSLGIILSGLLGAVLAHLLASKDDRPNH
jgi:hypothetical protein